MHRRIKITHLKKYISISMLIKIIRIKSIKYHEKIKKISNVMKHAKKIMKELIE